MGRLPAIRVLARTSSRPLIRPFREPISTCHPIFGPRLSLLSLTTPSTPNGSRFKLRRSLLHHVVVTVIAAVVVVAPAVDVTEQSDAFTQIIEVGEAVCDSAF